MSKALLRTAKNVVNGYSSVQVLVRNATSNEPTGPTVDQLDELAEKTYDNVEFFEIMDMLDKRLNDKGKNWRHVAKSLTVLDYLVRYGSENCVLWSQENLYIIKTLREFMHEDEMGVDHGQIIRVKAKELTSLLRDEERLTEERNMRKKRRGKTRRPERSRGGEEYDDDLQRALEESRLTAEEEERRRRTDSGSNDDDDFQTALQLSKEEEELRRLRNLQMQQQQTAMFQQQQQQPMYYDVFGNPITPEEYMQYQQQLAAQQQYQQLAAQQQYQQLAQQQALAEQQYLAQQQYLQQQQQELAQQQHLGQQLNFQQQQQMQQAQTGSNNPFALGRQEPDEEQFTPKVSESVATTAGTTTATTTTQQQALNPTRTGNQSISEKYNDLNNLLASGTGLDTFGNTGQTRIPAQHTRTGTFINSQGTGYKQVTNDQSKNNPFLAAQYTGLPSTSVVPSYTGYGFGNQQLSSQQGQQLQQQQQQQQQQQRGNPDQGISLIDL